MDTGKWIKSQRIQMLQSYNLSSYKMKIFLIVVFLSSSLGKYSVSLTVIIFPLFLGLPTAPTSPLLIMTPTVSHNNSLVCQGIEIVSCDVALVNWISITSSDSILLPTGDILELEFSLESYNGRSLGKYLSSSNS